MNPTQAHALTHAHARTDARAHKRTDARTHTHAHAHQPYFGLFMA